MKGTPVSFDEVFSAMADRAMQARKLVVAGPVPQSDRILAVMDTTPRTVRELVKRSGVSKQRVRTYIKSNPKLFVISYQRHGRGGRPTMEASRRVHQ